VSKQVRTWLRQHHQTVLHEAQNGQAGVRIIPCWLPTKSPWLNRIEPKWVHGKRAMVKPARLLTAQELKQRVGDYFGGEPLESLTPKISYTRPSMQMGWCGPIISLSIGRFSTLRFFFLLLREPRATNACRDVLVTAPFKRRVCSRK
jgi:hypothetical protein